MAGMMMKAFKGLAGGKREVSIPSPEKWVARPALCGSDGGDDDAAVAAAAALSRSSVYAGGVIVLTTRRY